MELVTTKVDSLILSRDLLWTWTERIVKARHQQSVLGSLWIVIQPAVTVALFAVIFTLFVPVNTGNTPYIVFSYTALVPWMLFTNSLNDMANALIENMQLITKIYFPRAILPVAAMLARLVDFLIAAGLLVVLILYYELPFYPAGWPYLLGVFVVQLGLTFGLGLALAASNVFYRDVRPLLVLAIQLWFYASPIIYPVTAVPAHLRSWYFLNPMAGILQAYRDLLIHSRLPGPYLLPAVIEASVLVVAGYWLFRRVEFEVADIV